MPKPTFTAPPATLAQRNSTNFAALKDASLNWEATFSEEMVTAVDWVEDQILVVDSGVIASNAAISAANYKGDYNAGTEYQIGESVTSGGDLYQAKTVNTGVAPTDGANWRIIPQAISADYTGDVDFTGLFHASAMTDAIVTLTGTTPTIDLSAGGEFRLTTSGNTTVSFSNPPANGRTTTKTIRITGGGTHTLTFTGVETLGGEAPEPPASGETKEYTVRASTVSGTTIYVLTDNGVFS